MAYCHECGSEVAETDAFCPFCGITLQPMVVAGNDASLDSTIVIPFPEKEKIPEEEKTPANQIFTDSPTEKNKVAEKENIAAVQTATEEHSNNLTAANNSTTEAVAVESAPTEIPAQNSSTRFGEIPEAEKTQFTGEKDKFIFSENTAQNNAADDSELAKSAYKAEETRGAATESSLMSYEETEIKEIPSAEEPETVSGEKEANEEEIADENESEPLEIDFTATIPHIPAGSVQKVSAENIENKVSGNPLKNKDEFFVPAADEETPVAEESIVKPAEELPETTCPPPRFDSVRIMEIDSEPKIAEKKPEMPSAAAPSPEALPKNRSFTTPNLGLGETDGKNRAKLKPLDEGTVLNDRYEIVRKIGGGGMGAVYLASDKNLGGVLRAVKEMVQSYIEGEQQEKAINDFKRESLLLSTLDHPSIPTIYDYFFDEKEGRFYLVMKYISGGDLAARIRSAPEGRIDEKSVTEWAIQIADVLDYLHNRQMPIVYRDLKPANIMIDGNSGRVMLIDFGIARFINKEEKGVTAVGTMGYAPPELFSGNVEPRSDIYSLGSTMFHLLTGADPQSNPLLIFDFQKHPRPRQINPQLSDQMEKILMRAVEYNADQRFSSAAELRDALQEHLKNLQTNSVTYGIKETPAPTALSDQLVFCGFCGQKIVATDMFCAFCGAKQPLAQKGTHGENYAPQPLTAKLLIVGTNELETPAYRIEKDENLVGRRDPMSNIFPEVDLSKFDPQTKISRRHARIWRDGSQFMVEDLGSSNGTIVLPVVSDTVRLMPHQPYTLTNGDKLKLGDTTLHFIIG